MRALRKAFRLQMYANRVLVVIFFHVQIKMLNWYLRNIRQ